MKTTGIFQTNSIKKWMGLFFIAGAILVSSCEGPMGPPGMDGDTIIGSVFEIQGNFTPGNSYTLYTEYPSNITVYDGDAVLVYILWEVDGGLDVWRLCPQTVVLNNGVIQYNYDYTLYDVQVMLEFTIPENELLPSETQNQIFRIAVLPADFVAKKSVDLNNFNNLLEVPELELNMLNKIDLNSVKELN